MKKLIFLLVVFSSLQASEKTAKLGINTFALLTMGQVDITFEGKLTNKLSLGFEHQFDRQPVPEYFGIKANKEETRLLLNFYPYGVYVNGFVITPTIMYSTGYVETTREYFFGVSALSSGVQVSYSFGNDFLKIDPFFGGGWVMTHDLINELFIYSKDSSNRDFIFEEKPTLPDYYVLDVKLAG